MTCLFCEIPQERIIASNDLAYGIRDGFEVTKHHTLFMPKRHIKDYFGLSQAEINAINQLIESQKEFLDDADSSIDGYNIGMNCGETAGQTIFHCHVHLIPRRKGDVENPRGGVRHVIAGKGYYEDKK
jgi:diadenosine tetraphosphate (Ap4A) HIT family hydrolase